MDSSIAPYPKAVESFPTLRQSLLSSFDNCGLTTRFTIDYRQGWSTHPQARGQIFHRVAAECLRTMARQREEQIPPELAVEILREVLRQNDADRICPKCGTTEIELGVDASGNRTCGKGHKFETDLVNVPIAMAKELFWVTLKWAKESRFDIQNIVDVEQRLKAELQYPNHRLGGMYPRTLTGQIDALFIEGSMAEHAIVIDWKDMWSVPADRRSNADPEDDDLIPDDAVSFQGYFQQRFYAWLIFKNYPSVQKVTLREFYVRFSQVREATVNRGLEEEIEHELAALAERFDRAYSENVWRPTPGKHCSYCIRPSGCPIPVFGREEGRITDMERAIEVARQLIVAAETVKTARKSLRAFADVHGPIPVKDAKGARALGYVEQKRTKRPDLETIHRAEVAKGSPLTAEEIGRLYKTSVGTKFQAFVPEEVDESKLESEIQEQLQKSIAAAQETQKRVVAGGQ